MWRVKVWCGKYPTGYTFLLSSLDWEGERVLCNPSSLVIHVFIAVSVVCIFVHSSLCVKSWLSCFARVWVVTSVCSQYFACDVHCFCCAQGVDPVTGHCRPAGTICCWLFCPSMAWSQSLSDRRGWQMQTHFFWTNASSIIFSMTSPERWSELHLLLGMVDRGKHSCLNTFINLHLSQSWSKNHFSARRFGAFGEGLGGLLRTVFEDIQKGHLGDLCSLFFCPIASLLLSSAVSIAELTLRVPFLRNTSSQASVAGDCLQLLTILLVVYLLWVMRSAIFDASRILPVSYDTHRTCHTLLWCSGCCPWLEQSLDVIFRPLYCAHVGMLIGQLPSVGLDFPLDCCRMFCINCSLSFLSFSLFCAVWSSATNDDLDFAWCNWGRHWFCSHWGYGWMLQPEKYVAAGCTTVAFYIYSLWCQVCSPSLVLEKNSHRIPSADCCWLLAEVELCLLAWCCHFSFVGAL